MKFLLFSGIFSFGLMSSVFAMEKQTLTNYAGTNIKPRVSKVVIFQPFALEFHPKTTIAFYNETGKCLLQDFEYAGSNKFNEQDRINFENKFDFNQLNEIINFDLKVKIAEIVATVGLVGLFRGLQIMKNGETLPKELNIKNPLAQALTL